MSDINELFKPLLNNLIYLLVLSVIPIIVVLILRVIKIPLLPVRAIGTIVFAAVIYYWVTNIVLSAA